MGVFLRMRAAFPFTARAFHAAVQTRKQKQRGPSMIAYKQVDPSFFPQYDRIPMRVHVTSYYRIEKANRGLGGFALVETPTTPYVKDFCTGKDVIVARWGKDFDLANWAFFMAFDGGRPVGAAAVASRTAGVNMLADRHDLAVLWDIRVDDAHQHRGVGQTLFDMAAHWSRAQGHIQMKIECQNNNVPAVRFYHKQGAWLCAVDEYAYFSEPEYRHEAQLIWYLNL